MREWGKQGINSLVKEPSDDVLDPYTYGMLDKNIRIKAKKERPFSSAGTNDMKTKIVISIAIIAAIIVALII
jgi:hypothetical protein